MFNCITHGWAHHLQMCPICSYSGTTWSDSTVTTTKIGTNNVPINVPIRTHKEKTVYVCGVDWQHEIGQASDLEGKMPMYSSIEKLRRERKCTHECGIVELKIREVRWVQDQKL